MMGFLIDGPVNVFCTSDTMVKKLRYQNMTS